MIDKSIRPEYVMQGKVKNYLGKQDMVKAPKKWKSAPDHPETELAYITEAEKDALVEMNLHGSMNGKANKGPSGIISLNGWGDAGRGTSDASYGGGNVSGGGDNRDYGGGRAAEQRSARAAATQEAARVAAVQANEELTRQREMKDLIAKQQEEKYDVPVDPTKFGETISDIDRVTSIPESERTIEDKLAIEDWEKDQDYEKVKELADRGESFQDIQKAMDKGLLMKQDAIRRQGLIERGLAAIKPTTKLESKLLPTMTKKGLTGFAKDSLGRMAFNLGAKKLGLGSILNFLNPALFAASLFTKGKTPKSAYELAKNFKKSNITTGKEDTKNLVKKPPKDERDGNNIVRQVAGDKDVISEGIKKFTVTDDQRKEAMERRRIVQNILKQGSYQGNELTNQDRDQLTNYIAQIDKYLVPVKMAAYGGRIDKPFAGRSRDI